MTFGAHCPTCRCSAYARALDTLRELQPLTARLQRDLDEMDAAGRRSRRMLDECMASLEGLKRS